MLSGRLIYFRKMELRAGDTGGEKASIYLLTSWRARRHSSAFCFINNWSRILTDSVPYTGGDSISYYKGCGFALPYVSQCPTLVYHFVYNTVPDSFFADS